jgi:hypothetical protein
LHGIVLTAVKREAQVWRDGSGPSASERAAWQLGGMIVRLFEGDWSCPRFLPTDLSSLRGLCVFLIRFLPVFRSAGTVIVQFAMHPFCQDESACFLLRIKMRLNHKGHEDHKKLVETTNALCSLCSLWLNFIEKSVK